VTSLGTERAATSASTEAASEVIVVVDGARDSGAASLAFSLRACLAGGLAGRTVTVLVATTSPDAPLVAPDDHRAALAPVAAPVQDASAASRRILGALLREADRRSAVAALVWGGERDPADWPETLLAPILAHGYEFVSPAYRRGRLDGMLNTAVVYPLTRALYGVRLRQAAGREGALSPSLARRLLADPDWQRDPARAGSDAWLVAKVLAGRTRTCQAWLGRWPGDPRVPENASQALARVVGAVFAEMERHAPRWQRVEGSQPAPSFGEPGAVAGEDAARADVTDLVASFRLGLRELEGLWGRVLPPATLLALRRTAAAPSEALRVDDALWARVVYDFAVAHYIRAVERQQLLRSMTPLYLGWVAGFVNDVRGLDASATEARVEALCSAFEREKRYAIARWRWPDDFNP
jgi:hypothetical protein